MFKKRTLVILGSLISLISYGQGTNLDLPSIYVQNTNMGKNSLPNNIQGTPYLNDDFKLGRVSVKESSYPASLRYNAYADEIESKLSDGTLNSLLKREYVRATIGQDLFGIKALPIGHNQTRLGYVQILSEGPIKLYKKVGKKLIEAKVASSSYGKDEPAKLVDVITYYMESEEKGISEIRLKKKDILAFIDNNKAKKIVDNQKLKLKTEEEVKMFLTKLNL